MNPETIKTFQVYLKRKGFDLT